MSMSSAVNIVFLTFLFACLFCFILEEWKDQKGCTLTVYGVPEIIVITLQMLFHLPLMVLKISVIIYLFL